MTEFSSYIYPLWLLNLQSLLYCPIWGTAFLNSTMVINERTFKVARVRSPVGTSFLGDVFSGFSSPVRQMSGSFGPPRSPNIIWPPLSSPIITHYGRQWPEMLTRPKTSNIQILYFVWMYILVWRVQLFDSNGISELVVDILNNSFRLHINYRYD